MSEPLDVIEGRYVLHGELASGGMATVHLGRQLGAGGFARTVAIKRLHARHAKDPAVVGRFLDEARGVARGRHPNVVQTLDVVATDKELFLVMDYVHGESLLALMRLSEKARAPVPVAIAKAIIVAVLAGLHAAHEATSETGEPLGVVHRDVSPHNVLVGADGVPRVLDFGIAKAQERVHSTQEGDIKGKLSYMTVEQIQGRPVDRRTDVFAAAIVLWELLTGKRLFDGENQAATMHAAMFREIAPPSRLRADVDAGLDAIVMRGLERDPARRFATAAEMAQALERTGGVASASEIAAWVRSLAGGLLAQRAATLAAIESRTPSGRLAQSDIERAISSRQIASLAPTSMPPIAIAPGSSPGTGAGPTAPALTAPPPPAVVESRSGAPVALAVAAVAVAVLAF
ncbi:MAG: serine/threonine protein kinase, partial [Myxococcales bacterium]|nr:serine/threonine protein kinase [Myxococcales bacterium]